MTITDTIRENRQINELDKNRYLLMAILVVGALSVFIGLVTTTASADPLPSDITSDVYFYGDQIYNNSAANLGAYLYIESGGNVSLDNVTIDVTDYSGIEVYGGGRLVINNSIIQLNGGYYHINGYYDSELVIKNSQIQGYDSLNLYTPRAFIDGNAFSIYDSYTNCVDMYYDYNYFSDDGPFITNNTFTDCYTGFSFNAYGSTMGEIVLKNNTFSDIYYYGINFNAGSAYITTVDLSSNTFPYTSYDGIYLYLDYGTFPTLNVDDNDFQDTQSSAINIQAQWSDYSNSEWSFSGNDIIVPSWYTAINFNGYYSYFNNVSISDNWIPSPGSGIQVNIPYGSSNRIEISGNNITNANGWAIYLYGYSSSINEIIFDGNKLEYMWWSNPIYFEVSYGYWRDLTISNNLFNHSYYDTIQSYIYGTYFENLTIIGNTINDTGSIWYWYDYWGYTYKNIIVSNNNITNLNGYLFYCDCYYSSFETLTIDNNFADGLGNYFVYLYMYYGGFSGDVNIRNNDLKNMQSGYYFYIYTGWNNPGGFQGNLNITDNILQKNQWGGQAIYIGAPYSNMLDFNFERNVVKDFPNAWTAVQFEMYESTMGYVRFNNNTIVKCQSGIYYYNGGGSATALFVQNNTVINNQGQGIYFDIWGFSSTLLVEYNLFIDNQYGMIAYASDGNMADSRVANNTFLKNQYGLYLEYMDKIRIEDNKITSNSQYGLYLYGDWARIYEFYSYNNLITGNGRDINLEEGVRLMSHNDTFETTSLQTWGGQSPEIWVMGSLDIQVLWEDGSGPVSDAELKVYDKDGANILDDRVDVSGWYKNLDMVLYKILTTGKINNIPVTINASKYGIISSLQVTPKYHTIVYVTLDNVPPAVTLFSPENMMKTNKNTVRVSGVTEPTANLVINGLKIDLTSAGTFEYFAPLNREGNNDIKIVAKDRYNNTRSITLHIFRDTVPPPLQVDEPTQGLKTNKPSVVIKGQTEPDAIVRINENVVSLDPNGVFEYTVLLTEGENNITILSTDPAGNEVSMYRIIHLDSVPPTINVVTPPNGLITNAAEVDIRGMASGATSVKLNGIAIKLLGETFVTSMKLTPGINTLLFEAWDDAGNYASIQLSIIQDNNPPQLEVISPKDNLFTGNEVLVVSGSSELGNTVTIAGVPVILDPNNGQFSYTLLLKEGTNRIVVRAVDKIGNTYEVIRNVYLDTTPPALAVTSPIDQMVTSDPRLVVEGLTDLNSIVTVNGAAVPTESGAFKKTITLKEGINRVVVIAKDLAGNRATAILEIYLDTTAGIQIYSPADGIRTTRENISISGKLEMGSILRVNGLDISLDNQSRFNNLFELQMGANDFEFVVTDSHGNINTLVRTVIRDQVAPPAKKIQDNGLSSTSAWLAAALVGALVGALMAIILFLFFSRKLGGKKEPTKDIEALPALDETPDEPEAPKASISKPAPPTPKPGPAKSKEIKMVPPLASSKSEPKAEASNPKDTDASPFSPDDDETGPTAKGMSDKAAGGELDTSSGELNDLQKKIDKLDAKGADTTKIKQSLRMAEIYSTKNNPDKADKHIQKAKQMLTEMDSSGEIKSSGGEVDMTGKAETLNPATKSSSIPKVPPFPDMDNKGEGNPPRKAQGSKDGGK